MFFCYVQFEILYYNIKLVQSKGFLTMQLTEAYELAEQLMNQYGLIASGWRFKWARSELRLGCCQYHKKVIKLSVTFVQLNSFDVVKNTILHEIAHAIVGIGFGHGRVWKQKAIELGCNPSATNYDAKIASGNIAVVCPNDGIIGYRYRMPKKNITLVCRKCKTPVTYSINYSLPNV
jgi:predicted SprT family Zn-dependent metalloprotease